MFQKLEEVAERFDALTTRLSDPDVAQSPSVFSRLAKERSDLEETVGAYRRYQRVEQELAGSEEMLAEESDPEMRQMAREEIEELRARRQRLDEALRALLIPKDPLDSKNTLLEIRAGTGGEEAALFAADLYRMYTRMAERRRWTVEVLSQHATGVGGLKEVISLISGKRVYSQL